MAKPEWGTKRQCLKCGAAFYDLNRTPIVCPKCSSSFDPEEFSKPRRGKVEEKAAPKKAPPKKTDELDEEALEEEIADDDLLEDAAELDEGDEDVAEVIEGGDDKEQT